MPSNWRSPPRPGEKSLEQGRSYNPLNREIDRRREGGGWVRSSDEAEQCPRSEGALLFVFSGNQEGKDEMIKASDDLQDLRGRIYVKAKAETTWRFWGLYVHVCKMETLRAAYALAKKNDGAPGIDGVTFAAIETQGVDAFLEQIADKLNQRTYDRHQPEDRKYRKTGTKSAYFRYLQFGIAWCKVRSSSYWSRSSRQTSNRDRLDIVPNGGRTGGPSNRSGENTYHRHRSAQLL